MRFIDSSVFLHAFLVPERELSKEEKRIKEHAKGIVQRVEGGEETLTSVVHLSEVLNVLESGVDLAESLGFLSWVIASRNVQVLPVDEKMYEDSLPIATELEISANDALVVVLVAREGVSEIYSFDKHFDRVKGIRRL